MSTVQEQIQECINSSSLDNIVKMMVVMAFWTLKRITDEEYAAFALQLGYYFDITEHTISKDADTFTILQILTMAADDVYPAKIELGKFVMKTVFRAAKAENYITAEDYTGLVAKL